MSQENCCFLDGGTFTPASPSLKSFSRHVLIFWDFYTFSFSPYFLSLSFSFCAVNSVLVLGFGCKLHLILIYPQIWRPHPKKKHISNHHPSKKRIRSSKNGGKNQYPKRGKETEKENNLLNKTLLQLTKEREYWRKKHPHSYSNI